MERVHLDVYHRAMPGCRACGHKLRDQIDAQLIHGTPYRVISQRFALSLGALARHRRHMGEPGTTPARSERGDELQRRCDSLLRAATRALRIANKKGDVKASVGAIGASTRLIEMLGRLSGALGSSAIQFRGNRAAAPQTPEDLEQVDRLELARILRSMTGFDPEKIEELRRLAEQNDVPLLPPRPADPPIE